VSLLDVLLTLGTPEEPRDGDCLDWAPRVTAELLADGLDAETVWVYAYVDFGGRETLLFAHLATKVGNVIVDTTARQFHPDFPLRWVAEQPQYVARVQELTGASNVIIQDRREQP
jgi:hypothetical protein